MLRLTFTNLKTKNITNLVLRTFTTKFTKEHEWVKVENGVATIGITDHAQNELGEIVHVDLPTIGSIFKISESLVIFFYNFQGAIESVKTAADIYSPVDGTVVEVNENLHKTPKLLNTHPLSQGWYAKLKSDEKTLNANISDLMTEKEYEKFLSELKH